MILWLLACTKPPSPACQAMLDCDAAWAAADADRVAVWAGDEDPTYGVGGSCWTNKDNAPVCTAACGEALTGYQAELALLVADDVLSLPGTCQ